MTHPKVTIHVCLKTIYLAVPRVGISKRKAIDLLESTARKLGVIPQDFLDCGLLGDPEPTLYGLRAKRNVLTETPRIKEWAA
jgi:hypothetical protein